MPLTFKPIFIGDSLFISVANLLGWSVSETLKFCRSDLLETLRAGYNLVVIQEDVLDFDLTGELKMIDENFPGCNILVLPRKKTNYSFRFLRYLSERAVGTDIGNK